MKLNEASNMSTEDKMYAWAKGTRKEAIKLAGDAKLRDFANTLGNLAIDEARKNNASLAKTLASKLLDIADVHHSHGNTTDEQNVRAAYQRITSQVDSILKSKNMQYQFAKKAFDVFQKLLTDNKNEFDSMIAMIDSLDSAITYPSWVTTKSNVVKEFLNNYLYQITEDRFYQDFVASYRYLKTVTDDNNCIAMDNTTNQCSYTEFGERIFAIYYLTTMLAAQAAIFGRKVMAKHSSKGVYCGADIGTAYSYLDIDIPVSGPHRSLARCSIKIYFGDIRNTSLADLQNQKVQVQIDYEVYDSRQGSKSAVTTSDSIVTTLKEFRTELYSYL